MTSTIETQKKKIAELESLLAPAAEQVIYIIKTYNKDIKKDMFQYFVGRITTFRDYKAKNSTDMKISLMSVMKRKHNMTEESLKVLSTSIDVIDSFFKEIKSFEASEKVVLKTNDWTKYMKEKLFY
jgi:hypothetical protein